MYTCNLYDGPESDGLIRYPPRLSKRRIAPIRENSTVGNGMLRGRPRCVIAYRFPTRARINFIGHVAFAIVVGSIATRPYSGKPPQRPDSGHFAPQSLAGPVRTAGHPIRANNRGLPVTASMSTQIKSVVSSGELQK